jgi:hemerythrin superfamily protein
MTLGITIIPTMQHDTRARLALPTEPLRRDHRMIRALLRDYDALAPEDTDRREWIFRELRRLLVAHLSLEEEIVYPAVEKMGTAQAARALKEARGVHDVLRRRLTELSELELEDPGFESKMRLLRLNVEEYAVTEERTIFAELRGLSPESGESLRRRLDRRRDELRHREGQA